MRTKVSRLDLIARVWAEEIEGIRADELERRFGRAELADLTFDAQVFLGKVLFAWLDSRDIRRPRLMDESIYFMCLDAYGINCPHPPPMSEPYGDGVRCRACDIVRVWERK